MVQNRPKKSPKSDPNFEVRWKWFLGEVFIAQPSLATIADRIEVGQSSIKRLRSGKPLTAKMQKQLWEGLQRVACDQKGGAPPREYVELALGYLLAEGDSPLPLREWRLKQKAPVGPDESTEVAELPVYSRSASLTPTAPENPTEAGLLEKLEFGKRRLDAAWRSEEPWEKIIGALGELWDYLETMEKFQTAGIASSIPSPWAQRAASPTPAPFAYSQEGFDSVASSLSTFVCTLESLCKKLPRSDRDYVIVRSRIRTIARIHGQLAGPGRRRAESEELDLALFDPMPMCEDGMIDEGGFDEAGLLEVARQMGLPVSRERSL